MSKKLHMGEWGGCNMGSRQLARTHTQHTSLHTHSFSTPPCSLPARVLAPSYTVDNHPYLPLYGLCTVLWAIMFVKLWESESASWACKW